MRTLLAILTVSAAFTGVSLVAMRGPGAAPPGTPAAEDAPATVRGHLDAATSAGPDAGRTVVRTLEEKVTISIRSSPRASVRWGGRTLGETPLTLERPRESGPMDLTLSASGYLPLHVRAYTFSNDTISARLVSNAEKTKVFGYPASLDAGVTEDAPPVAPEPMDPGPTPSAP